MKKRFAVCLLICFTGAAAVAQSGSSGMMKDSSGMMKDSSGMMKNGMMKDVMVKDGIVMKDGKVTVMKGGMSMTLMKDTTLRHGTMVMMDGTVKKKDGSTYMLKEGDYVMPNGKVMMKSDKMSDGKM